MVLFYRQKLRSRKVVALWGNSGLGPNDGSSLFLIMFGLRRSLKCPSLYSTRRMPLFNGKKGGPYGMG